MELTWNRLGISVAVQREPVKPTAQRDAKGAYHGPSAEQRCEVDNHYTVASGSRYVAPVR